MTWFTRLRNWQTDQSNGIGILSTNHDQEDNNFALGINECINYAGLNSPTTDIPWGTNKITGLKNGTLIQDACTVGQAQTSVFSYYTDSGTTNAFVITPSPAITSYVAGQTFKFVPGSSNTAACTINVSGLGVKSIKKDFNVDPAGGDIAVSKVYEICYDGTNFQLVTPIQGLMGQSMSPIYAADAGGNSSYAITLAPALTVYNAGQLINFKANTACSGGATLNVNSLGAKTILKDKAAPLANNDILAGQDVQVIYDGTNFQMLSPIAGCVGQNGASIYAADTGSANAYAVTLSPVPNAYATGMVVRVKASFSCTGSSTLNVNALGAITIKKYGATNLATGDIVNGQFFEVAYDGTNYQLLSPIANTGTVTSVATGTGLAGGPITGSGTLTAGNGVIVQCVSVQVPGVFTTTSQTFVDVTSLTLSITPTSANSSILVIWALGISNTTNTGFVQLVRGATPINIGTASSSRPGVSGGSCYSSASDLILVFSGCYLDSPATTSSTTYKIQTRTSTAGGTSAIGASSTDANADTSPRVPATITLMEVYHA